MRILGTFISWEYFLWHFYADYNRCSWIYKITRFNYWVIAVLEGGEFAKRVVTKIEQVQTRRGSGGSRFWSFCENVIIE